MRREPSAYDALKAHFESHPEERLHHEYFSAAPADTAGDGSFEMEVASTGQVIVVDGGYLAHF